MAHILVTGAAGFIGFHLSRRLLERGDRVVGIDSLSDYYDVSLKEARLRELETRAGFTFRKLNIADRPALESLFRENAFERVVHLAAQAGVRYSLENPQAYVDANLVGFVNMLECGRHYPVDHFVYASSSSVYGLNREMPFATSQKTDRPVSLYGATKKANELLAHSYAHLFGLPCTGLRFFTVYGPWGRPDMAIFSFTRAILADQPIKVFNHGKMRRDFTYIDDIVESVVRIADRPPQADDDAPPAAVYNIGNHEPEDLMALIALLEKHLDKKATLEMLPMQPGDVPETYADVAELLRLTGFRPATPLDTGIERFVRWYKEFYKT